MSDDCSNCPPMPSFDTAGCVPEFLRWPTKLTPQYKVPEGANIIPIGESVRARNEQDTNGNPNACEDSSQGCKGCISDRKTGIATESANINECEGGDSNQMEPPGSSTECCSDGFLDVETNPTDKIRSLLKYGCDCSQCVPKSPEPEPMSNLIPDLDPSDQEPIEVKADWLMQTPCACSQCIPKGQVPEGENSDEECFFPTVTCGECGTTRGQNPSCLMCCFSTEMEHERRMLELTCTACGTVTETCQANKNICDKVKVRGIDEFDYDCDGKPIYEGGMSIERMQHYLWKLGESNGPNGFEDLAYIDCDDDGCEKPEEEDRNCNCKEFERLLELQSQDHKVDGVPLHEYIYAVPFWPKKDTSKVDCIKNKSKTSKNSSNCK